MRSRSRPALLIASAGLVLAALSGTVALGANGPARQARAANYPLRVIAFETNPKRPKAGKAFIALAAIVNEETGEPVSGELRCPARIGRKGVRVAFKQLDTGVAGCGWTVPAGTGGKRLRGSIEVTSDEGYDASAPFSRVIRR